MSVRRGGAEKGSKRIAKKILTPLSGHSMRVSSKSQGERRLTETAMKSGKNTAARLAALCVAMMAAACTVAVDDNPLPRPGPQPQICTREYVPVCAARNGERRTFSNECIAETSGFRVISDGECRRGPPSRPIGCPEDVYAPVCAARPGERQTFDNSCEAEAKGYQVIQNGQCRSTPRPDPGPVVCPQNYAPVCARQGNVIRTFSNECIADGSGFQIIGDGAC
jgi:Kazal-type serine protease inhibitor domain